MSISILSFLLQNDIPYTRYICSFKTWHMSVGGSLIIFYYYNCGILVITNSRDTKNANSMEDLSSACDTVI